MKIELIKQEEWDQTWFKVVIDDPYSCKFFTKEEEALKHYNAIVNHSISGPVLTILKSVEI
jgi:hypothetical protein